MTAAQAQQIALARLVLADPHTLVLDEATSLIDPRAARHLERSLAAVLDGRTVIAIAHRLFSAHDADRVAVVEDGVISEFGSHDELVAAVGRTRSCGTAGTVGTQVPPSLLHQGTQGNRRFHGEFTMGSGGSAAYRDEAATNATSVIEPGDPYAGVRLVLTVDRDQHGA